MDGKLARFFALAMLCLAAPVPARAAVVEISAMMAYSTSKFDTNYTSEMHRYTGTFDIKFTQVSALEFEYTDENTKYSYPSDLGILATPTREETNYKDTIYSVNWVQNLVSTKWIIQPYFLIGGGRMTRQYTMNLPQLGFTQTTRQNVVTGTGGLGLRLFLTKSMAIKGEMKTYVPNFQFSKWSDNQAISLGLSWAF